MPEYYSFTTNRIKDKQTIDDICEQLQEQGITDYKVIEVADIKPTYIIAGCSCETDCGMPFNLYYIFKGNEWDVELVYLNYAGEYGYIKNDIEEQQAAKEIYK